MTLKSKIAAAIFNSGLLVVVLLLLSAPLLMGQLLSTYDSGALGETTTIANLSGAGQVSAGFVVYPNVSDFHEYAQFSDAPVVGEAMYQTDVTFTAFAGQQAVYNALFTIYNTGGKSLQIKLEAGKLSSVLTNSRIWLSLTPDGQPASTLTTQAANSGSSRLQVAKLPEFDRAQAVVGSDVVEAKSESTTSLMLTKVLTRKVEIGEKVYLGPVYYNRSATPALPTSRVVVLQPQQKAVVSLAVETANGGTATSQAVLPLVITTD